MTLKFTEKSHRYTLDGKPCPGVTTLIGQGLPKPALTYWSAKCVAEWVADRPDEVEALRTMGRGPMVAALKGVPWEKRDTAAVNGTDVHDLAERLVHGDEVDVPEHLAGYVESCVAFLDDWGLTPLVVERPVGNREWHYAGKLDVLGRLRDGRTAIVDYKTGGIYGSVSLQLVAYARAEFYMAADDTEQPLPAVDVGLAVQIREDGYSVHEMRIDDEAWRAFLHVAYVGRRAKDIDGWKSEPVDPPSAAEGSAA